MRDEAIRNTHPTVVNITGEADARDSQDNVAILNESLIATEITRLQGIKNYNDKWEAYNEYVNSLEVTTTNGKKFSADKEALDSIGFKVQSLKSTEYVYWVESWGSFKTTKAELKEVLRKASNLTQAKIEELFLPAGSL